MLPFVHGRERARGMRRAPTDAEARLRVRLRRRSLARVQVPAPAADRPLAGDFACMSAKLTIELDGAAARPFRTGSAEYPVAAVAGFRSDPFRMTTCCCGRKWCSRR